MEIDGHPTQDLIEELERRGALRVVGTTGGPRAESLRFVEQMLGDQSGYWLFLPRSAYDTGLDEIPG
jgi:hypothetical protein